MSDTQRDGESIQDLAFDAVGATALHSYLSGGQDGQQWALLDNLTADDLRDVCRHAITLLREANGAIGLAYVALDGMTPRQHRFAAREGFLAVGVPYLERLAERLTGEDSGRTEATDGR